MSDLNRVVLCGHVGSIQPIVQINNNFLIRISLATNDQWTDSQGNKKESTDWHNIVFFNGAAKHIHQKLTVGSRLYVEGMLSRNDFEKDGRTVMQYEIKASSFTILKVK